MAQVTNNPEVTEVNETDTTIDVATNDSTPVDLEKAINGMSDEEFLEQSWKTQIPSALADDGVEVPDDTNTIPSDTSQEDISNETEPEVSEDGEPIINDEETDSNANTAQQLFDLLLANPIKAAKGTIKFDTPEEVLKAVQQSADYTRKMQTIKPHMEKINLLETNGLLDDVEALPRMIEAFKGDEQAILDLVKKHGIDVNGIGEQQEEYKPKIKERNAIEIQLNDTIEELKESGKYEPVADAFTFFTTNENVADGETSQVILTSNPALLENLSIDIDSGMYDDVVSVMEKQKLIGEYDYTTPNIVNYSIIHSKLTETKNQTKQPEHVPSLDGTITTNSNKVKRTSTTKATTPESFTQETELADAAKLLNGLSDEEYLKIFKR